MASKWLRAFLDTEESSAVPRAAERVVSANMSTPRRPATPFGTIGTNGTERGQAEYDAALSDTEEPTGSTGCHDTVNGADRSALGGSSETSGTNGPIGKATRWQEQTEYVDRPGTEERSSAAAPSRADIAESADRSGIGTLHGSSGSNDPIGTATAREKAAYPAELDKTEQPPSAAATSRADTAKSANRSVLGPSPASTGTGSIGTIGTEHRERDQADATRPEIAERSGAPKSWKEGYSAMLAMPMPSGFSPERWQRIVDAAGTFLDRWADVAIACGWSTLDAFGVDPDRPDARFDCMGVALLLDRCRIVAVDEAGADLVMATGGAQQRFRRRPLPPGTVPLWQLQ